MDFPVVTWRNHFAQFENWTRLSALISMTGYFETFVGTICRLSLMSDPGLVLRSSKAVDGIALIKRGEEPEFDHLLTAVTKGDWYARCAAYKGLFPTVPRAVISNLADLDAMRKLRNGVGHAFGRLISDYDDPLLRQIKPLQRLSESRLQRWLNIIETCANEIEDNLRNNHIGAFEMMLSYHKWNKQYHRGHSSESKAFRATVPADQGNPPSKEYFAELIDYYKQI
jgi:hypothetical protein